MYFVYWKKVAAVGWVHLKSKKPFALASLYSSIAHPCVTKNAFPAKNCARCCWNRSSRSSFLQENRRFGQRPYITSYGGIADVVPISSQNGENSSKNERKLLSSTRTYGPSYTRNSKTNFTFVMDLRSVIYTEQQDKFHFCAKNKYWARNNGIPMHHYWIQKDFGMTGTNDSTLDSIIEGSISQRLGVSALFRLHCRKLCTSAGSSHTLYYHPLDVLQT